MNARTVAINIRIKSGKGSRLSGVPYRLDACRKGCMQATRRPHLGTLSRHDGLVYAMSPNKTDGGTPAWDDFPPMAVTSVNQRMPPPECSKYGKAGDFRKLSALVSLARANFSQYSTGALARRFSISISITVMNIQHRALYDVRYILSHPHL